MGGEYARGSSTRGVPPDCARVFDCRGSLICVRHIHQRFAHIENGERDFSFRIHSESRTQCGVESVFERQAALSHELREP